MQALRTIDLSHVYEAFWFTMLEEGKKKFLEKSQSIARHEQR